MRKFMVWAFVGVLGFLMSGCCTTLSETPKMHTKRVQSNMCKDLKLMVEDWDKFWMVDRPSTLSETHM